MARIPKIGPLRLRSLRDRPDLRQVPRVGPTAPPATPRVLRMLDELLKAPPQETRARFPLESSGRLRPDGTPLPVEELSDADYILELARMGQPTHQQRPRLPDPAPNLGRPNYEEQHAQALAALMAEQGKTLGGIVPQGGLRRTHTRIPSLHENFTAQGQTPQERSVERFRGTPLAKKASDVADPLEPTDDPLAFSRELEVTRDGPEAQVSAPILSEKFKFLSTIMGQDEYLRFLKEVEATPPQEVESVIDNAISLKRVPDGTASSKTGRGTPKKNTLVSGRPVLGSASLPEDVLERPIPDPVSPDFPRKTEIPGFATDDPAIQEIVELRGPMRMRGGALVLPGRSVREEAGGIPMRPVPLERKPQPGALDMLLGEAEETRKELNPKTGKLQRKMEQPTETEVDYAGRDVAGVGELVGLKGSRVRGKVIATTAAPEVFDPGEENIFGNALELRRERIAHVVKGMEKTRGRGWKGDDGKWREGRQKVTLRAALAEPILTVELPSGKVVRVPASQTARIPWAGQETNRLPRDVARSIEADEALRASGAEGPLRTNPEDILKALSAEGGAPWISTREKGFEGVQPGRPGTALLDPVPTAEGEILVKRNASSVPEAMPENVARDAKYAAPLLPPWFKPSYLRGSGIPTPENISKLALRAKMIHSPSATLSGIHGGTLPTNPQKGKLFRVMDGGDEVLVRVKSDPVMKKRKLLLEWEEVGRKPKGGKWAPSAPKVQEEVQAPPGEPVTARGIPGGTAEYAKAVRKARQGDANRVAALQTESTPEAPPASGGVTRIISGGQTGADRAGLDVGQELGLETGGWAPKGFRTNTGPNPELGSKYGLKETADSGYRTRTIQNVKESDGTVWFGRPDSPGGKLTLGQAKASKKPTLVNPTPEQLKEWVAKHGIRTLNVAGNREETNPGIGAKAAEVLKKGLAVGVAAAGATLLGEDEAEAMRLPPVVDEVGKAITKQQNSAQRTLRSLGLPEWMQIEGYNTHALLENYGKKMEALGRWTNPETNIANLIPTVVRGGGWASDNEIYNIKSLLEPVRKAGLEDRLQELLNFGGYEREFRILDEKIARDSAKAVEAFERGENDIGRTLLSRVEMMKQRMAENTVVPGKLSREEVQAHLASLEGSLTPEERALIDPARQGFYDITRKWLTHARDEGLISDEQFAFYTRRGNDYIPMTRIMQLWDPQNEEWIRTKHARDPKLGQSATTARMSLLDEDVIDQEMLGSERVNLNPFLAVGRYAHGVDTEIQQNKIARAVAEFMRGTEGPDTPEMFKIRKLKSGETSKEGRATFGYYEKGLPVKWDAAQDVVNTLNNVDRKMTAALAVPLNKTRRLFHMMTATAHPAFMFGQVFMDIPAAAIKPNYHKYDKRSLVKTLPTFFRAWGKEFKAQMAANWGVELQRGKYAKEFDESGAATRALAVGPDLEGEILGKKRGVWMRDPSTPKKLMHSVTYFMEKISELALQPMEKASKYAAFETLRERGFGPVEAGAQTRNYGGSPDFARFGDATKALQDEVMFINPSVQGLVSTFESIQEDPEKWAKLFVAGGAALYATHEYNSQFIGADGVPEIEKVPNEEKAGNIIIMTPQKQQMPDGSIRNVYLKFPLFRELQLVLSPIVSVMNGLEDEDYTFAQGVTDVAENLLPIGGAGLSADEDFIPSAARKIGASLNPLLRYPLEAGTNTNFLQNTPIVGTRLGNLPDEFQSSLSTQPWAVDLGEASGFSPKKLEHFGNTFLPGLGQAIPETYNTLFGERPTDDLTNPLQDATKLPVVGGMLRRVVGTSGYNEDRANKINALYDFATQASEAAALVSNLKARNPERLVELPPATFRLAGMNASITGLQTGLTEIDKMREVVTRSTMMSPEEKQASLSQLAASEAEYLKAVDEVLKGLKVEMQ